MLNETKEALPWWQPKSYNEGCDMINNGWHRDSEAKMARKRELKEGIIRILAWALQNPQTKQLAIEFCRYELSELSDFEGVKFANTVLGTIAKYNTCTQRQAIVVVLPIAKYNSVHSIYDLETNVGKELYAAYQKQHAPTT